MVLEGFPGQIAIAGDVDQGGVGVPAAQLPAQGEAVPRPVPQIHVQKVDAPAAAARRVQKCLGGGGGANHLHVVVLHENFPLQGGLNLVADGLLVIAQINRDHIRPPMVSSWTNTPPGQLVEAEALG